MNEIAATTPMVGITTPNTPRPKTAMLCASRAAPTDRTRTTTEKVAAGSEFVTAAKAISGGIITAGTAAQRLSKNHNLSPVGLKTGPAVQTKTANAIAHSQRRTKNANSSHGTVSPGNAAKTLSAAMAIRANMNSKDALAKAAIGALFPI